MNFTSKIFGENMKRLTANIFLLFIISSFAFSFDVDVDRQKKRGKLQIELVAKFVAIFLTFVF